MLKEVERKESLLSEADEVRRSISEELRKTREQLKAERDKWDQERDGFKQVCGWVSFWLFCTHACVHNVIHEKQKCANCRQLFQPNLASWVQCSTRWSSHLNS